ncbi:MAG: DUF4406 domain-containing protein [Methylococcaceae bacterium]|nr:DUF4406 domain-containing protein [Methylococcaceae bacterium]MDP2395029.1 DUF4406 domain-containing protein [Methylococcaceae bacterium]MDP3020529.1 DUF4406 domain-containing protein [Methylococcaceae bacterium]MDP3389721.1 DUF4406 domain-containing protein [Methylococcaceae bacterium]MDP3932517.1 DUF4406 domain-containing protein [Methylococcaceae bacterium]
MTRIYLAGPMSGLPEFNYPAFNEAAAQLRARGFIVENPAENQQPPCGSWEGYMRLSLTQMLACDCVVLLPGYRASKGASVENLVASYLKIPRYSIEDALQFDYKLRDRCAKQAEVTK